MPKTKIGQVVWGVCLDHGKETSIAGLNNASKARSPIRSILWLIIFAIFMGLTLRQVVLVIIDFYDYPVLTNIDLAHRSEVPFPAVTVCNLNRYVKNYRRVTMIIDVKFQGSLR